MIAPYFLHHTLVTTKAKQFTFILVLLFSYLCQAQTFNYQAVVRGSNGDLVLNQSIGIRISIYKGVSPDQLVYTETQSTTTTSYGLLNISVGAGTAVTGDFTTINWSSRDYWLEVAIDITGGTTYAVIGTTKLQSVPYANYAMQSGDKSFSTTANVTSNASGSLVTDDFVFGSTQLDDNAGTTDDDSRMFFDKSKGAFRAGLLNDGDASTVAFWDQTNTGNASTAIGGNVEASGFGSVAIGYGGRATGSYALALNDYTVASGSTSLSAGSGTIAESFAQASIGSYNTTHTPTSTGGMIPSDRLFVIGNGNFGARSDALVVLKSGDTTLNGSLTIDGDNQGAGTAYTLPAQDGANNQVLTTNGSGVTSWTTGSGTGAFTTTANVTSNAPGAIATDDFVFGSTQLNDDTSTTDDNNRMFFDKSKGAFRAGTADGSGWDDVNVGVNSFAFGFAAYASGANSVAIGRDAEAIDENSIAIGGEAYAVNDNTIAIGTGTSATRLNALAIGSGAIAHGEESTAIGNAVTSESFGETSLGINNMSITGNEQAYVSTDRLFVIGNGSSLSQKSNALVMLKNGNTTLNGQLTIDGDNQGTGTSYTLPAQDGIANQVMVTNGSGTVSWVNNTNTVEAYTTATLNTAAGWQSYNALLGITDFQDPRYRKVGTIVYLEGMCGKSATINNGDIIMTLPVGYRPTKTRIFSVETGNGSLRVDVNSVLGTVTIINGFSLNPWVSLDGITFSVD